MSEVSSPSAQALSDGTYWNSVSDIKIFPEMSYNEFMDDGGLNKWLGHIQDKWLCFGNRYSSFS